MTNPMLSDADIFAIDRPEPGLLTYYVIASLSWGPAAPVGWVLRYLRYRTLRYSFTEEGISMAWGALFRRETHLAYTRIQDIQITSNVIERWLGLARIDIQTASGKAKAEMTIEGIKIFHELRDFLYAKMRGSSSGSEGMRSTTSAAAEPRRVIREDELTDVLLQIAEEVRGIRMEIRRTPPRGEAADV